MHLCQDKHRRIVLATLADEQRSLTLNDLTEAVCTYHHQTPITEASEDVITEIQCSLHHVHLPKIASKGLITYDPERHLVKPTDRFEQLQPALSSILDVDPTLESPVEQ